MIEVKFVQYYHPFILLYAILETNNHCLQCTSIASVKLTKVLRELTVVNLFRNFPATMPKSFPWTRPIVPRLLPWKVTKHGAEIFTRKVS